MNNQTSSEIKETQAMKPMDVSTNSETSVSTPTKNAPSTTPNTPPGPTLDSTSELTRANVESQGTACRLTDSNVDAGLDLFCYTKCDNDDNAFLKKCRGLVYSGDKLVFQGFAYSNDYNHTERDAIAEIVTNFDQWSFFSAHEGAVLRMFNHEGQWFLSTHRKLNAFRSKWSTRDSFGTLFKRALEARTESSPAFNDLLGEEDGVNVLDRFQKTLDPAKQYMFLLCNNEDNRIVCTPPEYPAVYHVGTFIDGALVMCENTGIPYPESHTFADIDDVLDYVDSEIDYTQLQGVVGFGPNNQQIKIDHSDYQELFRARGNEASIPFRYLQVRMNRKTTNALYHLYPKMIPRFEDYENTLYDIAQFILNAYIQRFINKVRVKVPYEEFQVIRECHSWYLEERKNEKDDKSKRCSVKSRKVISVLNKQPPTALNKMIRRFKSEQAKKDDAGRPRSQPSSTVNSPALTGMTPKMVPLLNTLLPPLQIPTVATD